jgi:hypothetical protein
MQNPFFYGVSAKAEANLLRRFRILGHDLMDITFARRFCNRGDKGLFDGNKFQFVSLEVED